ncbi:MAG TPA: riboflavin biosynthesis protein RibF [Tepidisphaeraceae bacterium]|nr:riboflavin biosynthesis protein RibF [Tepidisphaeraceae bacterium]
MRILECLTGLRQLPPGCVLSIGNFDGVHRGHQTLLSRANELRNTSSSPAMAVVTFEPHPLTVLRPQHVPPRLTSPGLKRELLAKMGVDLLVVLPPSKDVLNLTAEQFWGILKDEVRPSHLVEGPSFNFGKGRGGTIQKLQQWSRGTPVELHVMEPLKVPLLDMQVVPVSSSTIRWLLEGGRVRDAAICLGRPYTLQGAVVRGAARGRELGVPTANLQCEEQLIPADAVYAGRINVDGRDWPAAVSIGTNPTFGSNPRTVEAHLIGYAGDLYGRTLRLDLIDWLREQRTFAGIEPLKEWIAQDIAQTASRFEENPARPIARVAGCA